MAKATHIDFNNNSYDRILQEDQRHATKEAYETQYKKFRGMLKKDVALSADFTDENCARFLAGIWNSVLGLSTYRQCRGMLLDQMITRGITNFQDSPAAFPKVVALHRAVSRTVKYRGHMSKRTQPLNAEEDLAVVNGLVELFYYERKIFALSLLVRYDLLLGCGYRPDDLDLLLGDSWTLIEEKKQIVFALKTNKVNTTPDRLLHNIIACSCPLDAPNGHLLICPYLHIMDYLAIIPDNKNDRIKLMRAMDPRKTQFLLSNLGYNMIRDTFKQISEYLEIELTSTSGKTGRVTLATSALNNGVDADVVRQVTHHKSTAAFDRYAQPAVARQTAVRTALLILSNEENSYLLLLLLFRLLHLLILPP